MSQATKKLRAAKSALRELYAKLPHVPCKGLCQKSCGPIEICVGPAERAAAGGLLVLSLEPNEFCPMLGKDGKCTTYETRPYICRAWGAIDHPMMICPHGCRPEGGLLSKEKGMEYLMRLGEIEDRYSGSEPGIP